MIGPTEAVAGSGSNFVVVYVAEDAGNSNPGDPLTGLSASTLDISYWRQGAASVVALTEADATGLDDAHDPSDVDEIGNGYYLVHMPDAAYALGAAFVKVIVTATNAVGWGPTISLTDPVSARFRSHVITSTSASVLRVADWAGYANDELIGEYVEVYDSSADEWHPAWVTDFVTTTGDVTVESARNGSVLPFTSESGVDRIFRTGFSRAQLTVASVSGAVGSVTGNVGGNVVGTVAGVTPAAAGAQMDLVDAPNATGAAALLATAADVGGIDVSELNQIVDDLINGGRLDLLIDAIKAKTDSLTFTGSFVQSDMQAADGAAVSQGGSDPASPVGIT